MRKFLVWSGLAIFLVGCVLAWRAAHPPLSDQEQIAANITAIESAVTAGSARGILAQLAPDFQFRGTSRKDLGQQLTGVFFQNRDVRLQTSGVAIQIEGDEATTTGHYALQMPETATGDFKAWWRRENGEWKIYKVEGTNVPN